MAQLEAQERVKTDFDRENEHALREMDNLAMGKLDGDIAKLD